MSQPRRRPKARPTQKRRSGSVNPYQRVYAILGVLVAFALIAAVVGPPLIDFLTQPDNASDVNVDDTGSDPVVEQYQTDYYRGGRPPAGPTPAGPVPPPPTSR